MINVEDHAAHCRMAREIIIIATTAVEGPKNLQHKVYMLRRTMNNAVVNEESLRCRALVVRSMGRNYDGFV